MKCKFCREEIPEGAKTCPNCGTPVEFGETEIQSTEESSRGKIDLPKQIQDSFDSQESAGQNRYQYGSNEPGGRSPYRYGSREPGQENSNQYDSQESGRRNPYQYGSQDPGKGNYGQPGGPINGTPYMIFAIITTLLCCLPLGIAAIMYAGRINMYQRNGDYAGAQDAANKARLFSVIGAAGGVVVTTIYIAAFVLGMKNGFTDVPFFNESEFQRGIVTEDKNSGDDLDTWNGNSDKDKNYDAEEDSGAEEDSLSGTPAEEEEEMGDSWDDYTVQINGRTMKLPCKIEELEAAGLTMDKDEMPEDYIVDAGEYVAAYFEDEKGNYIIADIINMTDDKMPAEKCLVGGISVMDYSVSKGGLTFVLPGGVKIGTEKDVVLERYGETDDFFEGDNIHTYTWYKDDVIHTKCEIDMDAESRLVTGMSIENFGE